VDSPSSGEDDLRRELSRVDAELASIPADQFAERSELLRTRSRLADELRSVVAADDETLRRWAERAASKDTSDGAKPYIESRFESGSI
jgi:hypothetical protein